MKEKLLANNLKEIAEANKNNDNERVVRIKENSNRLKIEKLIACYSRGDEISTIMDEYVKIFDEKLSCLATDLENSENDGSYISKKYPKGAPSFGYEYSAVPNYISLSVLLDNPKEEILKLNQFDGKKNAIISFIINGKITEEIKREKFYKDFQELYDIIFVIEDKKEQSKTLESYINTWVKLMRRDGYKMTQKQIEQDKFFIGNWCFEAAAVTKILNISDEHLKEHPFYPYDMVHWKGKNNE
jgi:hypothetical protein